MHHAEEILVDLVKTGYGVHFSSDAVNEYWAVSVTRLEENETKLIARNERGVDLQMGQGLKRGSFTYAQLFNLVSNR